MAGIKNIPQHIHAAVPVRVCDIGGWTDTWFAGHGAVFNIAVTPEVKVDITTTPTETTPRVTLNLGNYNETYTLEPGNITYGKHPLIDAAIDAAELPPGVSLDIRIFSEVPAGASVGTSAAVCVALAAALDALTPGRMTPHEIAGFAHRVETEKLGLQCGIQDQLCCAHGGINFIRMPEFPTSEVTSLTAPPAFLRELEKRLALVYIGTPHNSSEVHQKVIADLGGNAAQDPRLEKLRRLAARARDAFTQNNLEALGKVMNANTDVQRQLHPELVCEKFEQLIEVAGYFGVLGCKVNGAGGDGGSVSLLCGEDMEKKNRLLQELKAKGFFLLPLSFSPGGVRVW